MILLPQNISIFGIYPKEDDYAHKSDIIRLYGLLDHGGIYLDIDVIILSSFDNLLNNSFTMGRQNNENITHLCNAIIISSKSSIFLNKWYELYVNVDFSCWPCHSVYLPGLLSKNFTSNDIKILNKDVFFRLLWFPYELDIIFNENNVKYHIPELSSNVYAQHLWGSQANMYVDNVTEASICLNHSYYSKLVHYVFDNSSFHPYHCNYKSKSKLIIHKLPLLQKIIDIFLEFGRNIFNFI